MRAARAILSLIRASIAAVVHPGIALRAASRFPFFRRGFAFMPVADGGGKCRIPRPETDFLRRYVEGHDAGRGIWKWDHYFAIYERHFAAFRGRDTHLAEIGIFSGGSLEMWRAYLGPNSKIFGIDIEPACRVYEGDGVRVFIGDQADRAFWDGFRREVPRVDIVIDDGGHTPEQQIVSLEELLPHLSRGGLYVCEDPSREFGAYMGGLLGGLNEEQADDAIPEAFRPNALQELIAAVHVHPFLYVIERNAERPPPFTASRRGTQWQPWL